MSTSDLKEDLREELKGVSPLDLIYLEQILRDRRSIEEKLSDKSYWDMKYKEFLEDNEI